MARLFFRGIPKCRDLGLGSPPAGSGRGATAIQAGGWRDLSRQLDSSAPEGRSGLRVTDSDGDGGQGGAGVSDLTKDDPDNNGACFVQR